MKITLEIEIPEDELSQKLAAESITREEFIAIIQDEFAPLANASELVPGATARITITTN